MPHELKLSKKQFNAMVRDVHKDMMKGSGATDGTYMPPATIPDFSGPDLHFFVEDSGMEGGGWRDTLSSVWNSVKKHVALVLLVKTCFSGMSESRCEDISMCCCHVKRQVKNAAETEETTDEPVIP